MPSALPDGEPAPTSGELPSVALDRLGRAPFGVYVHVPFCTVRCGYCDFNTYTLTELGDGSVPGAASARMRRRRSASSISPSASSATRRRRSRRCSSVAAPPPCFRRPTSRRCWGTFATGSGSRPARRSPPRRTPTRSRPRPSPPWRRAASPGSASGCRARCPTCCGPSTGPTTRPTSPAPSAGPGVRDSTSASTSSTARPGIAGRLAAQPRHRHRPPPGPRLRLCTGRRGGDPARRPGPSRRGCGARGR